MTKYVLRHASRDADEIRTAREALNEKIRSYKTVGEIAADTKEVYVAAELIRQLVRDQVAITDPTPMLFEVKQGPGLGNQLEIKEFVNTAKVVERSLGAKPVTYTPSTKAIAVSLRDYDVNFAFELEQVLTGQMDAELWVDFMAEAVSRFKVSTGLSAIDTACAAGVQDAYGQNVRTSIATAVNSTTLDAALKRLGDVNSDVVIAGRYSALFPILGFSGFSDAALEEIRQAGMIGTYKGAKIVVLRDSYDPFFGSALIPADRIYLAGAKKGGVQYEEDMSRLDYAVIDQEEQHFRVGAKLRTSFVVHKPWTYHVIEIT